MGVFSSIGDAVGGFVGGVDDMLGGYAGEILGGVASAYGAQQQQKSSEKMAKKQMQFQERMSSTAHQRQVEDLKKAGLNPILSANKGASSPGGAMGIAQNIAGSAAQTALQMAQGRANINLANNTAVKTKAEINPVELYKSMARSLGVTKWKDLPKAMQLAAELAGLDEETFNKMMEARTTSAKKSTYRNPAGTNTRDIQRHRENSRRHEKGKAANSEK